MRRQDSIDLAKKLRVKHAPDAPKSVIDGLIHDHKVAVVCGFLKIDSADPDAIFEAVYAKAASAKRKAAAAKKAGKKK